MQVSAKELRTRTRSVIEAISRGEEVILTYRGKARARILPIEDQPAKQKTDLFGIWRDNAAADDVEAYVDQLREQRY